MTEHLLIKMKIKYIMNYEFITMKGNIIFKRHLVVIYSLLSMTMLYVSLLKEKKEEAVFAVCPG